MAAITLGYEWHPHARTRRRKGKPVVYDQDRHFTLFGPNGSGKGVSIEIPMLLRLGAKNTEPVSIISLDPKGQNYAVTARWRRTVSEVTALTPFNPATDTGFNPLATLDPDSPDFFEHASNISEALIPKSMHGDPFWGESADSLTLAFVMDEVKTARAEDRIPTLENVRGMLTGDLATNAQRLVDTGDFQIASLAYRFMADNKTVDGIRSHADTATRWLLSDRMRASLSKKDGIDFARLKGPQPMTVYVVLDADKLETFSVWLRLVVACALNALYREGGKGLRTMFMLSEFAQLGELKPIMAALGQGRGFGIQLAPVVLQDLNQLRAIYGKERANTFLGMSGATFAFTPNDPETAEWMSKRSGEIMVPGLSASDDPGGAREGWRLDRRRVYAPDDLYEIPAFHGLAWFAGQSKAVPVYAPPYWDARANPDLVGRYDPDPFHTGTPSAMRRACGRLRFMARSIGVGAVAAAAIGGLLWPRAAGPETSGHSLPALAQPAQPAPPVFHPAPKLERSPASPARHSALAR